MADIGIYNFVIHDEDVDFLSKVRLTKLAEYFLTCAGINAKENGFSLEMLQNRGIAWVLSRFSLTFNRIPKTYEEITIETWVHSVERATSERRFAAYDTNRQIIGYGSSTWAIINLQTRRIVDLNNEPLLKERVIKRDIPIASTEKIEIAESIEIGNHLVKYSDIDTNLHVNSLKYIQMAIDTIPLDIHKSESSKGLSINYINETRYGDSITIEKEIGAREAFSLKRADQKTACKIVLHT